MKVSAIRGVMLDPARLTERHEFYFDLLPQLARWGYNTLWLHLTDDEGCALRLRCNPLLPTSHAFGAAEVRRLRSAAAAVGIEVIPEIETLGHSLWITRHEEYSHLLNGDPWGHNALCPSHPHTLKLLRPIIEETVALFGSSWFHAGLDEAVFDDCARCRRRAKGRPSWWLFAEHVKAIHRVVTESGARMIMWADAIESHPELLNELPKDILLAHWHYAVVPIEKIAPSLSAGFEIVVVPAVSGEIVQPNMANLQNVRESAAAARRLSTQGSVGLVACWWESFRVLRDSVAFALAYGGAAFAERRSSSAEKFAPRFTADYFGLKGETVGRALLALHQHAPDARELKALYPDSPVDLHAALLLAQRERFRSCRETLEAAELALRRWRSSVTAHREQFDAIVLCARLLAGAYRNGARIMRAHDACETAANMGDENRPVEQILPWLEEARSAFDELAVETTRITAEVSAEWDRTRYPRDAKKRGDSKLLHQRASRAILANLLRSQRYLKGLARRLVSGGIDRGASG